MLRLCLLVSAASALKVTVLGGTGFVGSRVCHALATSSSSVEVVSVSRTGEVPEWCKGEDWTKQVSWVKNEFTRGSREKLQEAIGSPDAVVSCVGAIGVDQQGLLLGNGVANAEAAAAAKVVGAQRMAYVSVGSEVVASKGWCVAIRTPHLRRTAHKGTCWHLRRAAWHLLALASPGTSPPAQVARLLRGLLRGEASRRGGHAG